MTALTGIPFVGQYFECGNMYKSAAAGALVAATNTDVVFGPFPMTHFALAGTTIDSFCKGKYLPSADKQTLYNALAGIAGGMACRLILPRGLFTMPVMGTPV